MTDRTFPTPEGAPPASEMINHTSAPPMTAARAAVIRLLHAYEEYSFHEASPIEIQKLAYFLQQAGQHLRLNFTKGQYGPYADNLRKALREMEGHFISGFGDGSAKVSEAEPISVVAAAHAHAGRVLAEDPDTAARVDRVIALTDGFTSMYGLELLATVHWTVTHERTTRRDDVIASIRHWTPRKAALFTDNHIDAALAHLSSQNWLQSADACNA